MTYGLAMLLFNAAGRAAALWAAAAAGSSCRSTRRACPPVGEHLAFNTAVSFVTNTNWQSYGGESTHGLPGADGRADGAELRLGRHRHRARGGAGARLHPRQRSATIGNFWADLVRCTLYLLLPLCDRLRAVLVWQGVPQNLDPYVDGHHLEGGQQTIAQGPVASQLAIKMLGTNGGGFFNANSAHPYENPTPLANFVQMLSIFAIGAGLTNLFGRMAGDERQGWAILAAMGVLFLAGVAVAYWAESQGNPALTALGVDGSRGNMEGKEVRFGIVASALFAVITTAASCGAVNAMHASFMPLGGMIPLINMELGEIIVGGVGAGLYGMLLFVIVAMFVAGLMVGRTPEYVGKKLEAREVKMTMLAILVLPLAMLGFTALAVVDRARASPASSTRARTASPRCSTPTPRARPTMAAPSPASPPTRRSTTRPWASRMLLGRFGMIVPMLAVAGSLAAKKRMRAVAGHPAHQRAACSSACWSA